MRKTYRRKTIPWMAFALTFLVLRLGPFLTIKGISHPNIVLPKHFLDELIPGVFEAFGMTADFYMGVLLPLAVLSCYGTSAILGPVAEKTSPVSRIAFGWISVF